MRALLRRSCNISRYGSGTGSLGKMAEPPVSTDGELATALLQLSTQPWAVQEPCYSLLIRLLENIVKKPDEEKFRRINAQNPKIKTVLLDVPGGTETLQAAGFRHPSPPVGDSTGEENFFVLRDGTSMETTEAEVLTRVCAALEAVKKQANEGMLVELRRERDAKIAAAKEEDRVLNENGTFSRGLHKLKKKAGETTGGS